MLHTIISCQSQNFQEQPNEIPAVGDVVVIEIVEDLLEELHRIRQHHSAIAAADAIGHIEAGGGHSLGGAQLRRRRRRRWRRHRRLFRSAVGDEEAVVVVTLELEWRRRRGSSSIVAGSVVVEQHHWRRRLTLRKRAISGGDNVGGHAGVAVEAGGVGRRRWW